jgi:hypothetical protein
MGRRQKQKPGKDEREVGLDVEFSNTLFGRSEWMIKSGEAAHATSAKGQAA